MKRYSITLVAFLLLSAACGQYPGVHEQAVQSGAVPAGQTGITTDTGAGTTAPGGTALPGSTGGGGTGTTTSGGGTTGGTVTGGTTTGGTTGGGTTGGGGGGGKGGGGGGKGGGGGGGAAAGGPGDRTGITATEIRIGIHAPLTGAAPLAQTSFNAGKDVYWLRGNNGKPVTIHGRQVKVFFQDDQYNPSHARAVCQQMAEQDKVFALFGGGGTDQIQACAQYAASKGVPYISAGVTEIGLNRLPNYFASSMSYPAQVPLLAQYVRANASALGCGSDGCSIAMVATNTPNFDDAVAAFQQSFPGAQVFRPDKNERGGTMAGNLCTAVTKTFEVVFPLTAPTYYLEMAGAAQCRPQYVGIGVTMGLDTVAATGCRAGQSTLNARFFSPAPAYADSNQYDPAFRPAAQAHGVSDDIVWLLWASSKLIHQMLDAAGPNVSRQSFIQTVGAGTFKTGIFPDVTFTPGDHFGSSQVHVLKNVCSGSGGNYVTEQAFKSSF